MNFPVFPVSVVVLQEASEFEFGDQLDFLVRCEIDEGRADTEARQAPMCQNAFADGDEQRMMLLGLKRFTKYGPFNSKDARRRIADKLIAADKYCF